jgi:hypothetical protein
LLGGVAATIALSGCGSESARCIDQTGRVRPDYECRNDHGYGSAYNGTIHRWVYGGGGGSSVGSYATGYSTSPHFGSSVSTHSGTVIRGGFGGFHGSAGG